eukprot:TRINITY_DN27598_c0_g1_i1.p1 TRINITY_DN27598_c0_g1~~TRINITY_DN27598_c0_g1_i1.p1  ORF type:complete len:168 (+),score=70.38 TRINITY_DN27598_c0_g1_i1:68-505(+)
MGVPDANDILSDEHAVEQAKEYLRQGDTVEFFEFVATSLLNHRPPDPVHCCLHYVNRYLATLNDENGGDYVLKVEDDYKPAKADATPPDQDTYMKKYHVSDFVDKWILALIAEKRGAHLEDPRQAKKARLEFHKAYLEKLRDSKN